MCLAYFAEFELETHKETAGRFSRTIILPGARRVFPGVSRNKLNGSELKIKNKNKNCSG